MPLPQNKIRVHLTQSILQSLSLAYPEHQVSEDALQEAIAPLQSRTWGTSVCPAFPWLRPSKSPPPVMAQTIAEHLTDKSEFISAFKPQGPYLNFFVTPASLRELTLPDILEETSFRAQPSERHVLIEYSQPNTHKTLHVGHMRNLCLGNALVRIVRYTGEKVTSTTYPGDMGTHVAKCLWHLKKRSLRPSRGDVPGEWLGKVYISASNAYAQAGPQDKLQMAEILRQITNRKGEFFDLWKETRQWSLELMKEAYAWADVTFDRWFWESEVDGDSLKYARALFKKGKLIEDQGAIGMDLSDEKLGFCMLIKSDGTGLYATKDLRLAQLKFEEYAPDQNVYIVDNRQGLHFQQVFKVLEKLGVPGADKCHHLAYEMVELPDGAMSSRQGNIVPLMELVRDMEKKVTDDYLKKYDKQWTPEEIKQSAAMIANGAIKYGMLRVDTNRKIIFDKDEWLKTGWRNWPLPPICPRPHSIPARQTRPSK